MLNDSFSKICLGTVQFGTDYGINNKLGKTSEEEVFKILDYSYSKGIRNLDTSYLYGSSEEVLGKYLNRQNNNFEIISKLPSIENKNVKQLLDESLVKLNQKNIYGYLIHHFDFFKKNTKIWNNLIDLKNEGFIKKIGFSIYYPEDLEFIYSNNIEPDIIQCPYNIFDQRFQSLFTDSRFQNIEFYVRSIFLQGLFFIKTENLPKNLIGLKNKLNKLNIISQEYSVSIPKLALLFAINTKNISKIILGVDNLNHIKDLTSEIENITISNTIYNELLKLKDDNESLILPLNWNK